MPIRANAVITAKVRGTSDLTVLRVLTNLYTKTGLNLITTPIQRRKSRYCELANTLDTNL